MLRVAIALALSGVFTAPAFAQQIVKCTDPNGRIEYRNSACPSGTTREAVQISNLSIIEAERRSTADRRADDSARSSRAPANGQAAPAAPQAPSAPLLAPGSERGGTAGSLEPAPSRQR